MKQGRRLRRSRRRGGAAGDSDEDERAWQTRLRRAE
jgi:hypothetical protein